MRLVKSLISDRSPIHKSIQEKVEMQMLSQRFDDFSRFPEIHSGPTTQPFVSVGLKPDFKRFFLD